MTTIVAIGDIHKKPGARSAVTLAALDQALNVAESIRAAAIVFLGDLFDKTSTIEDRNALAPRIQRCASIAPTGILPGNHDADGDLEILGRLQGAWPITVFERPGCYRFKLATGEFATVFALPYPHRHGLVMAGCPNADLVDVAADHLDAMFIQHALELERARAKGDITWMIGHANISGAIASNGQPQVGREISVMPRHLDRFGSIPKLFGHIHKPQELHGAVYAGSISRTNFGEIEDKHFLVVSFGKGDEMEEGSTERDGWLHEIGTVGLNVPPMAYIEAHLSRDGFTWAMTAGPGGELQERPASFKSWEVRVRLRYNASEFPVLDKSKLLAEFAEASLLHFDPIPEKDHALRAPEVAAAKTLADKVAAFCAISGTVASEGVLQKLARLEMCDPVVVIENARDYAAAIAAGHEDEKATVAA